jgi:hypothetical protein
MAAIALLWSVFGVLVAVMLALKLWVLHRCEHEIKFSEAAATWRAALARLGEGAGRGGHFAQVPQNETDYIAAQNNLTRVQVIQQRERTRK